MEAHTHQKLAVSLAALLLHDAGKEVSAHNISTVLHHANIKVEAFWPVIMAKTLNNNKIEELILNTGAPAAAAAPVAAAAAAPAEEKAEEKKEEKKEEKEEEDFGGFGDLF